MATDTEPTTRGPSEQWAIDHGITVMPQDRAHDCIPLHEAIDYLREQDAIRAELLAALELVMEYEDSVVECEDAPDCQHDFCDAKERAHRAIARARGEVAR